MKLHMADLFCGAGGSSTGAVQAAEALGYDTRLTAVNHWETAVATHTANHPKARHLCALVDDLNPRKLFKEGQLDLLLASPECTHHSNARGGRPMNDQSRATAFCVTRWVDALRPKGLLVENVPEFISWGPIGTNGRPLKSRRGETFKAWINILKALGYKVDYRVLCAADYGVPTTRRRLFVQAVLGKRKIAWPDPTHAAIEETDLLGHRKPYASARSIVDWSLKGKSIFKRKRPLAASTMGRVQAGLNRFGSGAFILAIDHNGRQSMPIRSVDDPLSTLTTKARHALCEPFLVTFYGNGGARDISAPLDTVTTKDRFALVEPRETDVLLRMLQPHELSAAMSFPSDYKFSGTLTEQVKQIGNAVPCGLVKAIVGAMLKRGGAR